MPPTRENRTRITTQVVPWVAGAAAEAVLVTHGTSAPAERDRILVELFLARNALIELVAGAGWAWGSNRCFPASGISHSGGPRADAMHGG